MSETRYATSRVTSKDGTTIGFYRLGEGPGVVLLHGGMESALSHIELAEALADEFTVYLPDRRGRGLSGRFPDDFSASTEVEDMAAVLADTGARCVFGISSGAIVWLHACLALDTIDRAAIYEPPLSVDGKWSGEWTPSAFVARYDRELASGKTASALALGMKVTKMGPSFMYRMPLSLLTLGSKAMMFFEQRNAKPGDVPMKALAPTLHYDTRLIIESEPQLESFSEIRQDVLLLGGSDSPNYLKRANDAVERLLPNVERRVVLPGVGHGGSGNANRGGKPQLVADELRRFFAP